MEQGPPQYTSQFSSMVMENVLNRPADNTWVDDKVNVTCSLSTCIPSKTTITGFWFAGVVIQNQVFEGDNKNNIEQAFESAMCVLTEINKTLEGARVIKSWFEENQFPLETEKIPASLVQLFSTLVSDLNSCSFLSKNDNQVPLDDVETDKKPSAASPQT